MRLTTRRHAKDNRALGSDMIVLDHVDDSLREVITQLKLDTVAIVLA